MVELPTGACDFVFSNMRFERWQQALNPEVAVLAVNRVFAHWAQAAHEPGREEWNFHSGYKRVLLEALKFQYAQIVEETLGIHMRPNDCPFTDDALLSIWLKRRKKGQELPTRSALENFK